MLVNVWSSDIRPASKMTPTHVARYMFIKSLWISNQVRISLPMQYILITLRLIWMIFLKIIYDVNLKNNYLAMYELLVSYPFLQFLATKNCVLCPLYDTKMKIYVRKTFYGNIWYNFFKLRLCCIYVRKNRN